MGSPERAGLPSKAGEAVRVVVEFDNAELSKLDEWIARRDEPRPDREQAVRMIVSHHLGGDFPSSPIPNLVTGRDIVE